ncbi:NAD(P)-dependent oxidoreductase [Nocardia sp. NPDC004711]
MTFTRQELAVAVLGTGTIGAPIARNLRRAGFAVTVWNRTVDRAHHLRTDDVRVADSVPHAVHGARIVLTVVKDAAAVLAILEAAGDALTPGTVLVQISTVGVQGISDIAKAAAARSLVLVDAPVQGTKGPAENAQLVVLASGPREVRAAVAPVFDAIGKATIWVSDRPGDASKLKLVVNTLISAITHGVAESIRFAEALGVDPQLLPTAVTGGPLESAFGTIKTNAILQQDFSPNFTVDNAIKDTELAIDAAAAAKVWLPQIEAGLARYRAAQRAGHGHEDMAASYFADRSDE